MNEKQQIYFVSDGKVERLVRAANKSQVRAHLVKPLKIEYAEQDVLARLVAAEVVVEQAANGASE